MLKVWPERTLAGLTRLVSLALLLALTIETTRELLTYDFGSAFVIGMTRMVVQHFPGLLPAHEFLQTQQATTPTSKHKVEIQTPVEGQPQIVVTNLSAEPMTAFILEMFSSSNPGNRNGKLSWDAYVTRTRQPIEKDGHVSMPLPFIEGRPYPDKVVIAAAIWEDGTTEGSPDSLKLLFNDRLRRKAAYEWSIALLKKGLAEDWGREQYLAAFDDKNPGFYGEAGLSIKATVQASREQNAKQLRSVMQRLLETFTQTYDSWLQI
jgi:hypothetical protein